MSALEKLRILVPLDGTIPGHSSLMAIHPLIQSGPVDCTLLHVAEQNQSDEGLKACLELNRAGIESMGVPARVRIVSGKPAEMILRQASSGEFDLVAMSTHGRQGLDRVMMGSVAEEVVRSSPVPILLCRSANFTSTWEHIVVALNGMPDAEEVLEDVVLLARRLRATVHLFQVGLNLLRSNSYRGVALECSPEEPTSYLEDVASRLRGEGITVTTDRRVGKVDSEIAHFAREMDAGLVCMTTHGLPEEIPGFDRSVAAHVIRHAPCPVFVRRMTSASCRKR